jgi:hypothetical protein
MEINKKNISIFTVFALAVLISGVWAAYSQNNAIGDNGNILGNTNVTGTMDFNGNSIIDASIYEIEPKVNVKAYGAIGDGTYDDYSAIQSALNAAGTKPVLISNGDFKLSHYLTLNNDQILIIDYGTNLSMIDGGTLFEATDQQASTHRWIIVGQGLKNVKVLNYGAILPEKTWTGSYVKPLLINNSENVEVRIGTIKYAREGIAIHNSQNVSVHDADAVNVSRSAVWMECTDNADIYNIRGIGEEAIDLNAYGRDFNIYNIDWRCINFDNEGIDLNRPQDVTIESVNFENCKRAVNVAGAAGIRFGLCSSQKSNNTIATGVMCKNCSMNSSCSEGTCHISEIVNGQNLHVIGETEFNDDVSIHGKIMGTTTIMQPPKASPVLLHSFDYSSWSESQYLDNSGYNIDLNNSNVATIRQDGYNGGGYASFNGVDSGLFSDNESLSLSNFTVSLWFRLNINSSDITDDYMFIQKGLSTKLNFLIKLRNSDKEIGMTVYNGGGYTSKTCDLQQFEAGTWHQVAWTYNGTKGVCYIDGNRDSGHEFGKIIQNNNAPFHIGIDPQDNYPLDGDLDDIQIYNVTFTDTQIQALYAQRTTTADPKVNRLRPNFVESGCSGLCNSGDFGWNTTGVCICISKDTWVQ